MSPRHRPRLRWLARTVVVSVTGALMLVGTASVATADVVVDPAAATQGAAARLTFRILNDSATTSIVKVDMLLPAEAPIADVYPLSVDDWAPAMTMRTLPKPLQSLHGPLITEAVASVTWTAVEGHALPPGKTAELYLTVGPLPEVERLAIGVVVTDSAGAVTRWTRAVSGGQASGSAPGDRPAPVVVLRPEPGPPETVSAVVPAASGSSYLPWTFAILAAVALLTMWGLWAQRRRSAALAAEIETNISRAMDKAERGAPVHH